MNFLSPPLRFLPLIWSEVFRPWKWPYPPHVFFKLWPISLLGVMTWGFFEAGSWTVGLGPGSVVSIVLWGVGGVVGGFLLFLPWLVPTGFTPLSPTLVRWMKQKDHPQFWRSLVRHAPAEEFQKRLERLFRQHQSWALSYLERELRNNEKSRLQQVESGFWEPLMQSSDPEVRKLGLRLIAHSRPEE